ncbi:MAG: sulfurtransferase [Burkholderiales bacterium]|nr:sulfurtransferase [Burkholderiales bacterium]
MSEPTPATPSAAQDARAPFRTLIEAADLLALRARGGDLVVLDCGFDLVDVGAGERAYAESHLPGALYAHLDRDLSGTKTGRNGRHPLPPRAAFAERAGAWGIGRTTQVVAYDAQGGAYAARAWWMLRWLGHEAVAVLDGGPAAWRAAGGSMQVERPTPGPRPPYPAGDATMPTLDADAVLSSLGLGKVRIIDARSGERFRGEAEPIDPVAGRIPGAINRFHKDNLSADGRFKPAAELRVEFERLGLGASEAQPVTVVHQCGSGVTACHNLLAMAHAGFGSTALYPGSWSEWCADPTRPVARG